MARALRLQNKVFFMGCLLRSFGETLSEWGFSARVEAVLGCLFAGPRPCRFAPFFGPFFRKPNPMPLLRFIPETTNVDFVKYRFLAFGLDGLLVVIAILSIWLHSFSF